MDPMTGRFVSEDPYLGGTESPVSQHRYLYANQSPLGYADPTGRFSLAEMSTVNTIVGQLVSMNIDFGRQVMNKALAMISTNAEGEAAKASIEQAMAVGEAIGAAVGVLGAAYGVAKIVTSKSFASLVKRMLPGKKPDVKLVRKLSSMSSDLCKGNIECDDIAGALLNHAEGNGSVLRIGEKSYSRVGDLNLPDPTTGKVTGEWNFHDVYTDGVWVYDGFPNAKTPAPMLLSDWERLMQGLNPKYKLRITDVTDKY